MTSVPITDKGPETEIPRSSRSPNRGHLTLAVILLGGGISMLASIFGWRQASLFGLGAALGLVLYHAAFGFASSWRQFILDGRGAGLRAQMLMLAIATAIFLPVLSQGSLFGQPVSGAIAPASVSVLVGAFLFGVGMQLGGGCASGTLYTAGGGSTRMVFVLIFFMVGSVIGSAHLPWWLDAPSLGTLSLTKMLGLLPALLLQLGLFGAIAICTLWIERHHAGPRAEREPSARIWRWQKLLQGPWPLVSGAILLALLNVVTLALAGHPWTVSFGYTLWGAKAAAALGLDVANWSFWTWSFPKRALQGSLFENTTSVMNFGILVGAFLAATMAGRFAPSRNLAIGPLLTAVVGGLLMGYGARLAFGCNVGAYFSGIASGSVHGWLWFVSAMAGTAVGVRFRSVLGTS